MYIYKYVYILYHICYIKFTCLYYNMYTSGQYIFLGCVSKQEIRSSNPIGLLPKSTMLVVHVGVVTYLDTQNLTKIPIWISRE